MFYAAQIILQTFSVCVGSLAAPYVTNANTQMTHVTQFLSFQIASRLSSNLLNDKSKFLYRDKYSVASETGLKHK